MSRVPIRLRVTLAFTAAMALVLVAAGLFVYLSQRASLDHSIDNGLRSRASDVAALARSGAASLGSTSAPGLIESDESFAQILSPGGRLIDSSPQVAKRPVLKPSELARAAAGPAFFDRSHLSGIGGSVRLLAAPVRTANGTVVTIVGSSLSDRDDALAALAARLLIGGFAALVLASFAGYLAAGAALRPVEAMRRRAAEISAAGPGERLPVTPADDELRRLGQTLNEMLDRIAETLERERRFVDDASHELRTPLALHKMGLELALRQGGSAEELRAAIASGLEETDGLVQLAEDLLVVARSEEGRLEIAPEQLAAADLLATVGRRFEARASQSGRALDIDGGDLIVAGDRIRLEQALTNMVDNAMRHGAGEIRLWAGSAEGGVRLHVSDQGTGFPPAFISQAFKRFSRADPARSQDGTGLGLAIVEAIATAHHGRVGAENDPGGGANVWIEVPAA